MKWSDKYEAVIGLEVHAQLLTSSKLFCGDATAFGAAPNSQVSPVSLAHPGTLPVMNKKVIELALRLGLALGCNITRHTYFARKNYFYPDLPKGYQVSQHTAPICTGGALQITTDAGSKKIMLNRIHMEEDAGKSVHDITEGFSSIDLNRAGTPLLEIVTEPCLHSAEEAFTFLTELRKLVRWLEVCDGNMEEGSLRCDANISLRPLGETKLGTRVEVKNLNSIRNVKRAIDLETERLASILDAGETVVQQTRSYDADANTSFALRSKEDAEDYRYFPEPDLPAFFVSEELLQQIESEMPELPAAMQQKFIDTYGLSEYDAGVICADSGDAAFYESLVAGRSNYKAAANWMLGPLRAYCNETNIAFSAFPVSPAKLQALIDLTETGKIGFNIAATRVLPALIQNPAADPLTLATEMNLLQESDESAIEKWISEVMHAMPEKVAEYKKGKKALLGMFAGQVKKQSGGKADMQLVNAVLKKALEQ